MSATTTEPRRTLQKTKTPGVYKRGNSYVIRYRDPSGKQKKVFARTYKEATRLRSGLVADVTRGEYRATTRITFAQYAPQWIDSYQGRTRRGIGPRTLALYRADLGLDGDGNPTGGGAVEFFGRILLAEIGPAELKAYGKHLSDRGLARSSVKRALAPVKALLATAHEDGLIRYNPAAGLRNLVPADQDAEAVEKVKALAPDELARLLEHIAQPGRRPCFEFLAETGLRIGEAIEVRWSDIDRGTRTLTVARQYHRGEITLPKGRKVRRVPLSTRMDAVLWELRKRTRAADGELVFTADQGGRVDQKNLAARTLKPASVAAGLGVLDEKGKPLSWVGFHTFRHTCLTQLFRSGWNAAQVCKFAGHSDPGFTLRTYVHLLDEDLPTPAVLDSVEDLVLRSRRRADGDAELVDLDDVDTVRDAEVDLRDLPGRVLDLAELGVDSEELVPTAAGDHLSVCHDGHDTGGHTGATQATESGRNDVSPEWPTSPFEAVSPTGPKPAETSAVFS